MALAILTTNLQAGMLLYSQKLYSQAQKLVTNHRHPDAFCRTPCVLHPDMAKWVCR